MLCRADSLEHMQETNSAKLRKDISNIQYVFSLMMKHKSTKVPDDEVHQIRDVDIFSFCELNKKLLYRSYYSRKRKHGLLFFSVKQCSPQLHQVG